jgi:hypothetical protein
MFNCERCGAGLPPDRDTCAYCGTLSGPAHAMLQVEAARRAEEQARVGAQAAIARTMMLSATEQASSRALLHGLLSLGFFCIPVFNVLSFLAYKRAQSSARAAGVPVPTRATTGLICAAVTGVLCVVCWIWMIAEVHANDVQLQARKDQLNKEIAAHPAGPGLDHPLACALAELYLISNGYDGATNSGAWTDVTCAGSLRVAGLRAELNDFKFRVSSSGGSKTATICFKKGERWFVENARATSCELDSPAAPAASHAPAL